MGVVIILNREEKISKLEEQDRALRGGMLVAGILLVLTVICVLWNVFGKGEVVEELEMTTTSVHTVVIK